MKQILVLAAFALVVSMVTLPAAEQSGAQQPFFPGGRYDAGVPTPESVLGYAIGEKFTPHYRIVEYLEKVAKSSDRVEMLQYGTTYEGRPLFILTITSPANRRRLDAIRTDIQKLADPRVLPDGPEVDRILRSTPAIAWLSYGVHGNESSSSEAAMQVVYQLAAGLDDTTRTILDSLVVVIDPLLNPDGRDRYVNWYLGRLGVRPNPDPQSIEHREPWPGGRTNHYFFDLNRDWAWLTQKETKARIAVYRKWMPQVHVDYHEMSPRSTYFFFPATRPLNPHLSPTVSQWDEIYGRANAAAFDRFGWSYYTQEDFDLFYPGYGDSWPSLNGAIGMTYEQAGGGAAGLRIRRDDGTYLSLRDRARHHFITSMATLSVTARRRRERLADFRRFWEDALERGRKGTVKQYFVLPGQDPANAARLVNLLLAEGIEVRRITRPVRVESLHRITGEKSPGRTLEPGTYVVDTAQPANHLLSALFELSPAVSDTFFYDITAWSLPLSFGVEAFWSEKVVRAATEAISEPVVVHGSVSGDTTRFAFLIPWRNNAAAPLAYRLLRDGYKVRVATKPFKLHGRSFEQGTLVVPAVQPGKSRSALLLRLQGLADSLGVDIYSADTGLTEEGIDLGSNRIRPLRLPKIAVVTGEPVWSTPYGALWHLFDQDWQIPFAALRVQDLGTDDLSRYNVLILPDDGRDGRGYKSRLDSVTAGRLKTWVEEGGVLIGIAGGAAFATADMSKWTTIRLKKERKKAKSPEEKKKAEAERRRKERLTWEQKERQRRREQMPGAYLRVRLDNTHPLGFGYPSQIEVLVRGKTAFELTDHGHNVGYFEDSPKVAGYLSKKNLKKMAGSGYLMVERRGRGRVILITEDPTFRAFLRALLHVLADAIFFGHLS